MILESIILAVLAVTYISSAIYMVFLTFSEIYDWFASRRSMSSRDRTRVGFTLQELLESGQYRTVQGVFNTALREVEKDVRAITSQSIDDELATHHQGKALVLYE